MSTYLQKLLERLSTKSPEEIQQEFYSTSTAVPPDNIDLIQPTVNLGRLGGLPPASEISKSSLVLDQPFDKAAVSKESPKAKKLDSKPVSTLKLQSEAAQNMAAEKTPTKSEQEPVEQPAINNPTTAGFGFPEELQDKDLKEALQSQRRLQGLSLLLRGTQQLADAGVRASGGKPVGTSEFINAFDEYVKGETDEILNRRKGIIEEEALKRAQRQAIEESDSLAQSDPKSAISKAARDFFKKLGQEVPENISYNNLKGLIQDARLLKQFEENAATRLAESQNRAFERQKYMDMRLDQLQYKKEEDLRQAAERFKNAATRTEAWKQYDKLKSVANSIRQLAKDALKEGGQSLSMLGPKIAKGIAGEVGVLTEKDVTRYVQNPALVQGAKDALLKIKAGKLSEVSYDNIMRLLKAVEQSSEMALRDSNYNVAVSLSRNRKLPIEEAMAYVDPLFDPSSDTIESYVPNLQKKSKEVSAKKEDKTVAQAPKAQIPAGMSPEAFERAVQKVMKANNISRQEAVDAILKAQPKR